MLFRSVLPAWLDILCVVLQAWLNILCVVLQAWLDVKKSGGQAAYHFCQDSFLSKKSLEVQTLKTHYPSVDE